MQNRITYYKSVKIILYLIILILPCSTYALNTLFDYSSDLSESKISSDFVLNEVTVDYSDDPSELPARSSNGWQYQNPKITWFQKDSSRIISSVEKSMSYFGNHALSGEIWIYPMSENGALFSWGDTSAANHVCVFLKDGRLHMHRKMGGDYHHINSDNVLSMDQWYHVSWTNAVVTDSIQLGLYINGEVEALRTDLITGFLGLVAFQSKVVVGQSVCETVDVPNFHGKLYAARLNNYLRPRTYLEAGVTYDGSEYFGLPIFPNRGYDKSIAKSKTRVEKTWFIPYLNDYYIPQGLTCTNEFTSENSEDSLVYLTMYHKTLDGKIGGKNSILVEMDIADNMRVRRCFRLTGSGLDFGHVTAATLYKDIIFIGFGGTIYKCRLPEYNPESGKYLELTYEKVIDHYTSNLDIHEDTLWCGYWGDYGTTDPAYITGYPIKEDGSIITNQGAATFRIKNGNQGAAWTRYKGKKYLFVSTSWGGTNNSKLYRYSRNRLRRTSLVPADTVFEVPAGGEDIVFDRNNRMLNVSESGSRYYQTRSSSPWKQFFPFIFSLSPEVLFADVEETTDIKESQIFLPDNFQLNTFPNPFNNTVKIKYLLTKADVVDLSVYNLLGEKIHTLSHNKQTDAGSHSIIWQTNSDLSSGVYLLCLKTNTQQPIIRKLTYLK